MLNVLFFSPLALRNGRGGEISIMDLACGLSNYFNITLVDTNIFLDKDLLAGKEIEAKLKGVKKCFQFKFASLNISNKNFSIPYPWDILRLFKQVRKSNLIYFPVSTIKINLVFILFSLLHRNGKFLIGYRKPLHSDKLLSFYNIKYRFSILAFSLFRKKFYHHTISGHAKRFLEQFNKPDKVIHVIHGVVLNNYINNFKIKEKNETLKLIYVGNLDGPHKGVDVLLSAIDKLLAENKNLKIFFEFIGTGPLKSELAKLEEKFPNHIKYRGFVSNEKISKYYQRNDALLFSSRREPFGRVLIEALAANLLIICSKTIGSVEILAGKKFAFFLDELTPNAVINKIYEVYDLWSKSPEKFKELQESAKKYAFQNFSFTIELELFRKLISQILN